MDDAEVDLEKAFDLDIDSLPETVDRGAVRRMRFVAAVLDDSIRIPGTDYRVGLDPIVGVLPVAGDAVTGAVSLYIVAEAANLGVSLTTLVRMIGNIAVDVVGGSVPILGDIFDAAWKANTRNLELAVADLTGREPSEEADRETIPVSTS
jgi:hypothetical protein